MKSEYRFGSWSTTSRLLQWLANKGHRFIWMCTGKKFIQFPQSALAHRFCVGSGLEIGASAHNPFGLPTLNVDYTNSMQTPFKREEINFCGKARSVDIVACGDEIPLADATQDFVISSHVLEHFPNPIKALLEWDRLLRPDGIIFMIVPHKERTFDRDRPRTSLDHVIHDYRTENSEVSTTDHGHEHVWVTEDVVGIVRWMIDHLGVQWRIEAVQDPDDKVGNGFTIVIRKLKNRRNDEPAHADESLR